MKTTFVIALMLISMGVMAQKNTDTSTVAHPPKLQLSAGDEFIISSEHFYTGFFLETVGVLLNVFAIDYAARENNSVIHLNSGPGGLLLAGSLLDVAGAGFMLESRVHIKRAGILLNKTGVGVSIPIGGK